MLSEFIFIFYVLLQIHIKRDHLKERNHECAQCGKKFFLRDDLRTHARIHTGLKPYSCNICGKTFKHISHRNRHQNTNHTGILIC